MRLLLGQNLLDLIEARQRSPETVEILPDVFYAAVTFPIRNLVPSEPLQRGRGIIIGFAFIEPSPFPQPG